MYQPTYLSVVCRLSVYLPTYLSKKKKKKKKKKNVRIFFFFSTKISFLEKMLLCIHLFFFPSACIDNTVLALCSVVEILMWHFLFLATLTSSSPPAILAPLLHPLIPTPHCFAKSQYNIEYEDDKIY